MILEEAYKALKQEFLPAQNTDLSFYNISIYFDLLNKAVLIVFSIMILLCLLKFT